MSILFAAALMATLAAGLLGGRDHYTSPRSNDFTLRTCLMSPVIKKEKKKKKKKEGTERKRKGNGAGRVGSTAGTLLQGTGAA
jgi:hypothetical protein